MMKIKQKLICVTSNYYEKLIVKIEDYINDFEDLYEIQQIDYFSMNEEDKGECCAIILFKPKRIYVG